MERRLVTRYATKSPRQLMRTSDGSRACPRISPRTAQAPSATSCSGWRTTPSCSVVAGFLWTFVSPEAAFIYLGAWMLIALAALLRAR